MRPLVQSTDPLACHLTLQPGQVRRLPLDPARPLMGYWLACPACGSLNQTSVTEEGQTFEERDGHLVTFAPGFTCNRCDRLLAVHGSEWGTE